MIDFWDVTTPLLGLFGLLACGLAGWFAWRSDRRPAMLPVSLALFLIAFHRGYDLFSDWWAHEPESPLSTGLDLAVGVLALGGLWLLRAGTEGRKAPAPEPRGLAWSALALGLVAMVAGLLVGSLAYSQSREVLERGLYVDRLSLARSLVARIPREAPRSRQLRLLRERWEDTRLRHGGTYLLVIREDGILELSTLRPEDAGHPVNRLGFGGGPPLDHLMASREDWVGPLRNDRGEEEIGAFTYSPDLRAVVSVRTPASRAWAEVRAALLPWSSAFGLVLGLLLPISLFSLYAAFAASRQATMQARHDLEQTQARLHSVVAHVPVMLWALGRDGRFTLSEGQGLQGLGLHAGDAVGRTPEQVYGPNPELSENHRRALGGESFSTQVTVRDRLFESFYHPLRDGDGQVTGVLGVSLDVTDRLRTEEALERNVTQRKALFEQAMDGIYLLDDRRRVVDANPAGCRMAGEVREKLLGRSLLEVLRDTDLEDPDRVWAGFMDRGQMEGEISARRPDGTRRWLEYRGRARILPGLHLVLSRDVTARKQAEEEHRLLEESLERSRRLESLGVLAGGIAHDFNNLLMTILGNTDMALEALPESSPARQSLRQIAAAGRRASELTGQMLSYSGKSTPRAAPLHLEDLVVEAVDALAPRIPSAIQLLEEHDDDLPPVMADKGQIRQVVVQLLTNAAEALGSSSGRIEVRTSLVDLPEQDLPLWELGATLHPGPYVQLEVVDNGEGIPEDVAGKIFEPFFSTKFEGRGLGLAATLGILRGHGGAIRVESTPGRETRFRVLLPPAPSSPSPEPQPQAQDEKAEQPAGGAILVADDEEHLLVLLSRTLARKGFEVVTASDGREAVELFRQWGDRLRAVVMDVKMPRLGGVEASRLMRELHPEVPVILSTGFSEESTTHLLEEEGVVAVLHKPYRASDLVETLEGLGRSPRREGEE